MSPSWLAYLLVSILTGNPLLGLLAVAAIWLAGSSFYLGRMPDVFAPLRRFGRARRLRTELAIYPHNIDIRAELGGLLAERSPAEARALLEEVVARCPELPLPHYFLGQALLAQGKTEEGAASIERALKLKPDVRFGEPLLALGDHLLGRGKAREALDAYERATRVHSSSGEAWYKAGRAANAAGNAPRAKAHYEEALASTAGAPAFKRRLDRPWRIRAWLALRGF